MGNSTELKLEVADSDVRWTDMLHSLAQEADGTSFGDGAFMLECYSHCDYEGCGGACGC